MSCDEGSLEPESLLQYRTPYQTNTGDEEKKPVYLVSISPAGRNDVSSLHQNLEMRLKQRQAREVGICPIRTELYSQAFDEIIRHVTINCAERGLLLLRIRDEIRLTMATHQRLLENGFAYGTKKANLVEDGYEETVEKLEELRSRKSELLTQLQELSIAIDQSERKNSETREVEEKRTAEEIQFLKRANQQLRVCQRIDNNLNRESLSISKLSFTGPARCNPRRKENLDTEHDLNLFTTQYASNQGTPQEKERRSGF